MKSATTLPRCLFLLSVSICILSTAVAATDDGSMIGRRTLKREMTITAAAGNEIKVEENDLMDAPELDQFLIDNVQVRGPLDASNDLDEFGRTIPSMPPSLNPSIKPKTSPSLLPTKPSQALGMALTTLNPATSPPSNIPTAADTEKSEPVSFSGTIWNDVNGNGQIDNFEVGLASVVIQIKSCNTDETKENIVDQTVAVAFTKPDGSYQAKDVGPPGCYYVHLSSSGMESGRSQNLILESGESVSLNAGITTLSATLIPTVASSTKMPSSSLLTGEPSSSEPTMSPSAPPSTGRPSSKPTSGKPTLLPSVAPSTSKPSAKPTSSEPTISPSATPSTSIPSSKPTSSEPTVTPSVTPSTRKPSSKPTSSEPTTSPSVAPSTQMPTDEPTTHEPTMLPSVTPSTSEPSSTPSTSKPSSKPTSREPTLSPSASPSTSEPSSKPTSSEPTLSPSVTPSTSKPSTTPSTRKPSSTPTSSESKSSPSASPSTRELSSAPTSSKPTMSPSSTPSTSEPISTPTSGKPTLLPSVTPSTGELSSSSTSSEPTKFPSSSPSTREPSSFNDFSVIWVTFPSDSPTSSPSIPPSTSKLTGRPSSKPTSGKPTLLPSVAPSTSKPSAKPTSSEPTISPSATPSTSIPSSKPTSSEPTVTPSVTPSTRKPSSKPTSSEPTTSPSVAPSTQMPTDEPTMSPSATPSTSEPSSTPSTSKPSSKPTSREPTLSPSASPSTQMPTDEPTTYEAMISPSATPSTSEPSSTPSTSRPSSNSTSKQMVSPSAILSTREPSSKPTPSTHFPPFVYLIMKVAVFETQGELSKEAVADLSSAMNTFFGTKLTDHYNSDGEYFQTINLAISTAKQMSIEKQINKEPVRNLRNDNRRMEDISGTEIIVHVMMEFLGKPPLSNEIKDVITFVSKEYNNEFVSYIVDTGNSELSEVFIVLVEEILYVEDPSTMEESQMQLPFPSPSEIHQSLGQEAPTRDMTVYLMIAASIATLATLIIVFATRRRLRRAAHARNTTPPIIIGDGSISSAAIDLDGYFLDASLEDGQLQGYEVDADNKRRSSKLLSAAEINSRGTMTMEKNDSSVMPKSWPNAMMSPNSRHQGAGHDSDALSPSSVDDANYTDWSCSGFPQVADGNEYAQSASREGSEQQGCEVDAANLKGTKSWLDNWLSTVSAPWDDGQGSSDDDTKSVDDTSTENYSDCSRGDFSRNRDGAFPTTAGFDMSYIGTVDEDADENGIERALSQETDESKSSLSRFISDLVWLEQKIANETTEKAEIGVGGAAGGGGEDNVAGMERSDSYSYECDSYSSGSLSADGMTAPSLATAMSITVRDVNVPPGKLDVDIASTKDGPVISCIRDERLYDHFNVGDLIMAVDDIDTRSLSAEQMASTLSSRSGFQRKITLLHIGELIQKRCSV